MSLSTLGSTLPARRQTLTQRVSQDILTVSVTLAAVMCSTPRCSSRTSPAAKSPVTHSTACGLTRLLSLLPSSLSQPLLVPARRPASVSGARAFRLPGCHSDADRVHLCA